MTRDQAVIQVCARLPRLRPIPTEQVKAAIDEMYPRDNYRTKQEPTRDYKFGIPDVLEIEREVRRRMKV